MTGTADALPRASTDAESCTPGPTGEEPRDFFERTIVGWHLLFAGMVLLSAVLLVLDGSVWAVSLLVALVVLYLTLAVPAMSSARSWRNVAYLVGAYALFGVLVWVDPSTLVLLFALYPQTFAALGTKQAVVATITLTVGFTVVLVAREGFTRAAFIERGSIGLINLAFALVVGLFISGVVRQNEQQRALLRQLRTTQDELALAERSAGVLHERERLAREIHDTLAQGFTSIVMLAQAAESALDGGDPATARDRVALVQRTARENLAEARSLVAALRPADLGDRGLDDALRRLSDRFAAETGLRVGCHVTGERRDLVADGDVVLLRSAQEALANVRKHAGARTVDVDLRYDEDGAMLTVVDDGRGFEPTGAGGGYGLPGMRARVEQVGGLLDVTSAPGDGTTVRVRVP